MECPKIFLISLNTKVNIKAKLNSNQLIFISLSGYLSKIFFGIIPTLNLSTSDKLFRQVSKLKGTPIIDHFRIKFKFDFLLNNNIKNQILNKIIGNIDIDNINIIIDPTLIVLVSSFTIMFLDFIIREETSNKLNNNNNKLNLEIIMKLSLENLCVEIHNSIERIFSINTININCTDISLLINNLYTVNSIIKQHYYCRKRKSLKIVLIKLVLQLKNLINYK